MKIRLPLLATALASTLALSPGLSQASTLQERYIERVSYEFIYYFPQFPVAIESDYDNERPYGLRASVGTDPGGYNCLEDNETCGEPYPMQIYFSLVGSTIVPLDNMTLDLTALPATLGGYDLTNQQFVAVSYGRITFGPSGEIASYALGRSTDGEDGSNAEAYWASSTPSVLSGDGIVDGHLLEGLSVYDGRYWEPDENFYSLRPGYWRTSINRFCWYEDESSGEVFIDVPCPENNGGTPDPTTPIPLPAAGWLLLGGLGLLGLGAARRR